MKLTNHANGQGAILPSVFSSYNDWSVQILYRHPKWKCQVPQVLPSALHSLNIVVLHVKPWKTSCLSCVVIWVLAYRPFLITKSCRLMKPRERFIWIRTSTLLVTFFKTTLSFRSFGACLTIFILFRFESIHSVARVSASLSLSLSSSSKTCMSHCHVCDSSFTCYHLFY